MRAEIHVYALPVKCTATYDFAFGLQLDKQV